MTSHGVTTYNIHSSSISWWKQFRADHSVSKWSFKTLFCVLVWGCFYFLRFKFHFVYLKNLDRVKAKGLLSQGLPQREEGRVVPSGTPSSGGAGIWRWQVKAPPRVWARRCWNWLETVLFLVITLHASPEFFSDLVSSFLVLLVWGKQLTPAGSEDLPGTFCPNIPEVFPWPAGLGISALRSISPRSAIY